MLGQSACDGANVIGTRARLVGKPPIGMFCPSFSYTKIEHGFVAEQFKNGKKLDGRISNRAEPVPSEPVVAKTLVPLAISG
jgi:hypothetical protein